MVPLLPFDAHNHVQLGSSSPLALLNEDTTPLSGMAIMSTHPRDFPTVADLAAGAHKDVVVIPCMGVHPWFLHELTEKDWERMPSDSAKKEDDDSTITTSATTQSLPRWVLELESLLQADPSIAVGEIGLDNFHFNDPVTKELSTDMETQMMAMEHQVELAIQYQRPVSLHCVRAMGSMLQVWNKVLLNSKQHKRQHKLPPRIYFHAFGGKAATVIQLIRLLEPKPKNTPKKKKKKPRNEKDSEEKESSTPAAATVAPLVEETPASSSLSSSSVVVVVAPKVVVYFGFAPIVNFQSPKTIEVIRAVGLERLVLETDHEEAYKVPTTMKEGIRVISEAFGITEQELIEITNRNAKDLYMID